MAGNVIAAESQHGHNDNIDDSVVPGTLLLIDLEFSLQTKHSKAHQDVVLGEVSICDNTECLIAKSFAVPTPSDDPDDPVSLSHYQNFSLH